MHSLILDFNTFQTQRRSAVTASREERRRALAEQLSKKFVDGPTPLTPESEKNICPICQDPFAEEEAMSTLQCGHTYHATCIDTWAGANTGATCPQCRSPIEVTETVIISPRATRENESVGSNRSFDTPASESIAAVTASETSSINIWPWWIFHQTTQLKDRLSFIVDPGAWTNLIGANLARKLAARAMKFGYRPIEEPMKTMHIQGVGMERSNATSK